MLNELVGELMKSGAGEELLKSVQARGLSASQASDAVTATAEGAMSHLGGAGGLAGAVGSMLGGSGGAGAGGLASMAAGLLGGAQAAPTSALASFAPSIAQFVAQKTGLAPEMATMVVSLVLPKLETVIRNQFAGAATEGAGQSSVGNLLGELMR